MLLFTTLESKTRGHIFSPYYYASLIFVKSSLKGLLNPSKESPDTSYNFRMIGSSKITVVGACSYFLSVILIFSHFCSVNLEIDGTIRFFWVVSDLYHLPECSLTTMPFLKHGHTVICTLRYHKNEALFPPYASKRLPNLKSLHVVRA